MNLARPSVSFVIPTFRRPEALERTLRSISAITYSGRFEVVVIDDGSNDGTAAMIDRLRQESSLHIVLFEQSNAGAARARNRGAREAEGEVLVFLDDDMLVESDHLDKHLEHLSDSDARRIVNGAWDFAPEILVELERTSFGRFRLWLEEWVKSGIQMRPLSGDLLQPNLLTACTLGIRRKDFLDLGGFDESFPAAGYEDQEFSIRAARAGFEFIYDKRIVLSHLDQRTDLAAFSKRIRQGAMTAAIMATKYPDEFGSQPLIRENAPASPGDGFFLTLKKLFKNGAASWPGRAGIRALIWVLDHAAPNSRLMRNVYWKWCGIWVHQGVRDGLRFQTDG